jgi:hypothetical protein
MTNLNDLANSEYGLILMAYLNEKVLEMADISKLTPENVVGKQEAVKIIKELFMFLEKARQKQPEIKKTNYL